MPSSCTSQFYCEICVPNCIWECIGRSSYQYDCRCVRFKLLHRVVICLAGLVRKQLQPEEKLVWRGSSSPSIPMKTSISACLYLAWIAVFVDSKLWRSFEGPLLVFHYDVLTRLDAVRSHSDSGDPARANVSATQHCEAVPLACSCTRPASSWSALWRLQCQAS